MRKAPPVQQENNQRESSRNSRTMKPENLPIFKVTAVTASPFVADSGPVALRQSAKHERFLKKMA
jgi:hypothetical protein